MRDFWIAVIAVSRWLDVVCAVFVKNFIASLGLAWNGLVRFAVQLTVFLEHYITQNYFFFFYIKNQQLILTNIENYVILYYYNSAGVNIQSRPLAYYGIMKEVWQCIL